MKLHLQKVPNGLIPVSESDREYLDTLKMGQVVWADFKKMRNYAFLQKFMVLIDYLYGVWEPEMGEKNREQFREDVTILAGYYEQYVRLDGSIRTVAKSISFANMEEEEFAKLYNSVIDVGLKRILKNYKREDLDSVLNNLMSFA